MREVAELVLKGQRKWIERVGPWLEAGHDVGAHTRTHPILTRCTDEELMDEVDGSRRDLEAALGEELLLAFGALGALDERVGALPPAPQVVAEDEGRDQDDDRRDEATHRAAGRAVDGGGARSQGWRNDHP